VSTNITLVGTMVADPEIRFGATGIAILSARVVTSGRKKVGEKWEDVDTTYWNVSAFRQLAENAAESLSKGDKVIIVGKVKQRSYETAEGEKRTVTEVTADEIAANMRNATVKINRISRSSVPSAGKEAFDTVKADIWSTAMTEEAPF
jgi:single-strand DNA-binding protein